MGALPMASLLPEVGMEFSTIDEAWMFWISHGGQKGLEVRKKYMAINTFSQVLTVIFQTITPFSYTIYGHQHILSIVHPNFLFCRGQSQMMLLLISSIIYCLGEHLLDNSFFR